MRAERSLGVDLSARDGGELAAPRFILGWTRVRLTGRRLRGDTFDLSGHGYRYRYRHLTGAIPRSRGTVRRLGF
jgi:hypothetical protein